MLYLSSLVCQRSSNHKLKAIHNWEVERVDTGKGVSKIVKSQIESNSQRMVCTKEIHNWCVKDRQITNWKQFTTKSINMTNIIVVCQRSSNHKLKAIHNYHHRSEALDVGVSKIVKSQIESNSQQTIRQTESPGWCVKDRQITNWKQFTTSKCNCGSRRTGVSKIVKSQIESNSQQELNTAWHSWRCVKDRQITNWKQFTTGFAFSFAGLKVCQRSSNHKLKAIHNWESLERLGCGGVSKIVKSQIESNSQLAQCLLRLIIRCVKDRQITNWKQFTTATTNINSLCLGVSKIVKSQIESNSQLTCKTGYPGTGVSKIVKSQIESNSQLCRVLIYYVLWCVKDRQITNWKQFTTAFLSFCLIL